MKTVDKEFFYRKPKEKDIDSFLDKDEKILWRGMPKKTCYALQNSKSGIPFIFALIWLCFDMLAIIASVFGFLKSTDPNSIFLLLFVFGFLAIHMIPVWIWLHGYFKARREVYQVQYIITNKRLITFDGKPRYINFSVEFSKLYGVKCKQSTIDRIFNVADIYISSEYSNTILFDVPNGKFIGNKLQEICVDNKNDKKRESDLEAFYLHSFTCLHCGSYFDENLSRCPSCGAPKDSIEKVKEMIEKQKRK